MALDSCKWDGQVGDVTTLAPFAVVLTRQTWRELARLAELLAAELSAAESELASRPDLWIELGLPKPLREALNLAEPWTPAAARVIRFDFHPTQEGWRISEVNSDVPGGYTEASVFAGLIANHCVGAVPAGNPTAALCDAFERSAVAHGHIALLAAPGYTEDLQVTAHLSTALRKRGFRTSCVRPEQLHWHSGFAHVPFGGGIEPVDAIFRFYQGEWMTRLPGLQWKHFFRGGRTAVCNPPSAVLTESKRFPVIWPELSTMMPTWRELLPRTQRVTPACASDPWILKRSYSNNGDAVLSPGWSRRRDFALALAHGLFAPRQWAAQQKFETVRIETPTGPMHPCFGVFVVNGRACGVYGRLAAHPVIDFRAIDTAILVEDEI